MKELTKEQSERIDKADKNLYKAKLKPRYKAKHIESLKKRSIQPKKSEQPPKPKQDALSVSETLTPSEIEQSRREKKEDHAFFQKAFAHLKKK